MIDKNEKKKKELEELDNICEGSYGFVMKIKTPSNEVACKVFKRQNDPEIEFLGVDFNHTQKTMSLNKTRQKKVEKTLKVCGFVPTLLKSNTSTCSVCKRCSKHHHVSKYEGDIGLNHLSKQILSTTRHYHVFMPWLDGNLEQYMRITPLNMTERLDIFLSKKHYEKGLYFKRELKEKQEGILPINFSIPKEKIVKDINKKPLNLLSPLIPGKLNTYIYENENEYYEMYKSSIFALTYKKAGWDCLRHYEILMNGCIPLFLNLENCPDQTMVNFPKEKLINLRKKYDSVLKYFNPLKIFKRKFLNLDNITNLFTYKLLKNNVDDYLIKNQEILEIKEELLNYTKLNLTTEHLVKYILSKLS